MDLYTFKNLGKVGRLGNQLWQIASTVGLAESNGAKAYIRPSWEYKDFFSLPNELYVKPVNVSQIHDGGTEYFQDLSFWKSIEQEIFQWFQPSVPQRHVFDGNRFCSVHVRRGDYLEHPDLFPFCGETYYLNAFEAVKKEDKDIKFIVFSDDIQWCKDFFGQLSDLDFVFINGIERPVELKLRKGKPEDQYDLFAMMQCKYNIIANSTFSWWGAWLAGSKKVFYPSRWYGNGLSYIDWSLMIPDSEDWICINVD